MTTDITDILDLVNVQELTDAFYAATGIPSSVITTAGEILTGSGWQRICTQFHRKNPETRRKCIQSDTGIRERLEDSGSHAVYQCPHGLIDAAAPIVVADYHIANLFTGQFLTHAPSEKTIKRFQRQAERYGFDKDAYLEALFEVPIIPPEKVAPIQHFLSRLAAMLAEMGMKQMRLSDYSRELESKQRALELEVDRRVRRETALRRTEREKSRHNQFLEQLLDTIPAPVFYKDADGTYGGCNTVFAEQIMGLPKASIIGRNIDDLRDAIPAELADTYKQQDRQLIQNGGVQIYEAEVRCADGLQRAYRFNKATYTNDRGRIGGLIGVMLDLTENRRNLEEIQDSQQRFMTVLDGIDVIINIVDLNTYNILFMNKKMRDTYGAASTGAKCYEMFRRQDRPCVDCIKERLLDEEDNQNEVHVWEYYNPFDDHWYLHHDRMIQWIDGRQVRLQVSTDITRTKEMEYQKRTAETQLLQAQKMEALGTLAGGIAHDFNNILFPIVGFTEMAMDELESDDPLRHNLKMVLTAAARAQGLVRQILAFSRSEQKELGPIQLRIIVKEAVKLLRATLPTTIRIEQRISTPGSAVLADPVQLNQILLNLCTNAYHAMREGGGVLTISLDEVRLTADDGRLYPVEPGQYVVLGIADTGTGMDEAMQTKIFEPYFTTKPAGEGTGLGLATVYSIVKGLQGAVTLCSEPDKGTTFNVYLPRVDAEDDRQRTPVNLDVQGGNESIMVIDDEKAIVRMIKQMLTRLGYTVTAHSDSRKALAAFQAVPREFDLVITDLTMPRLTGDALSQQLLSTRPDIPIILCTGFSEPLDTRNAESIGIRRVIYKPVVKAELASGIRQLLDEPMRDSEEHGADTDN